MDVEFRDLRWAIIASQHRSLRQAAEALNVRQSTLSRRLRDLETQIGSVLFERTNGGTRPTIIGQEFLESARQIVGEAEAITHRIRTRSRGESGHLTIGVHAAISAGNLRASLIEYQRRLPDVQIHLVDGSSDHLISDLANSAIDIALIANENLSWDGKTLTVWSERVVTALPEDHPLSNHNSIYWADLKNKTILLPQRGPGPELLQLLYSRLGSTEAFRLLRHDVSADRLLSLVGAGMGLVLAFEGATGAIYPGVTFRELHDAGGPTRIGFRASWRDSNRNPSLRPFLDLLQERYPDLPS